MNSRAHCCSQISTFTQKDTILIDCYVGSLLSQHQKDSSSGTNSFKNYPIPKPRVQNDVFKNLFGKSHVFFLGVTNPREVISYSATFSACGRSVAWPVVLELLQDLKESDTNAVCLSSAADALEQGVSVTFFMLHILLSLFRHVLAFLEGETTGLVCRFPFPAMWSDQAQDSHFSDFVPYSARQSNGASHLGGTGGKC